MKVIISPAKKMNWENDSLSYQRLPVFLEDAKVLAKALQSMDYCALKNLWRCSDTLARENFARLQDLNLEHNLTPALFAYEGIQYTYMAPHIFDQEQFAYIETHLRILSGFYGLLRPFDGVVPYRLEMQARLQVGVSSDLYDFWGERLAKTLCAQTDEIVNLASQEYSKSVSPYLPSHVRFLTCIFGEYDHNRVVQKGTQCKMARGSMVRYMAEQQIEEVEKLKSFCGLEYTYEAAFSTENQYVFIKKAADK